MLNLLEKIMKIYPKNHHFQINFIKLVQIRYHNASGTKMQKCFFGVQKLYAKITNFASL